MLKRANKRSRDPGGVGGGAKIRRMFDIFDRGHLRRGGGDRSGEGLTCSDYALADRINLQNILSMAETWRVYDRFYDDDRVIFLSEPPEVEKRFREKVAGRSVSATVWADAWLPGFAQAAEGVLVTFDRALGGTGCSMLAGEERLKCGWVCANPANLLL
jgi:hypothetical protein